jgi:hypothetical protein
LVFELVFDTEQSSNCVRNCDHVLRSTLDETSIKETNPGFIKAEWVFTRKDFQEFQLQPVDLIQTLSSKHFVVTAQIYTSNSTVTLTQPKSQRQIVLDAVRQCESDLGNICKVSPKSIKANPRYNNKMTEENFDCSPSQNSGETGAFYGSLSKKMNQAVVGG